MIVSRLWVPVCKVQLDLTGREREREGEGGREGEGRRGREREGDR